jgi:hypothetical protein
MMHDYRSSEGLETALRQLADSIEIPPTPDYAARVVEQLTTGRRRRLSVVRTSRRTLLAAAAAVLLAAGAVAAIPATRHTLASWFGFSGIEIRSAPTRSTFPPPTEPVPLAAGQVVTLGRARQAVRPHHLVLPRLQPTDVYLLRDGAAVVVTIGYRAAPPLTPTIDTGYALIITEIFDAGRPLFTKLLYPGSHATSVHVGGHRAVFINGPQQLMTIKRSASAPGQVIEHEVDARASANTLIWSDGNATYRLEGNFTRHQALMLAAGLR